MLDVAIIGSGPAALSAAIYLGRAKKSVKIFEKSKFGGTLTEIAKISNYPGFIGSGSELAEIMTSQAREFGTELEYGTCTSIEKENDIFILTIDDEKVQAKTVLIATGSEPKPLDFELSVPVSYCVLCDANLYKDKNVAIVGGANSAVSEAIYLSNIAKNVTIISHSTLKAEQLNTEKVKTIKNITIR